MLIQALPGNNKRILPSNWWMAHKDLLQHVGQPTRIHLLGLNWEWNLFKVRPHTPTQHTPPGSSFSNCVFLNSNLRTVVWLQGFAYLLSFGVYWNILPPSQFFHQVKKKNHKKILVLGVHNLVLKKKRIPMDVLLQIQLPNYKCSSQNANAQPNTS